MLEKIISLFFVRKNIKASEKKVTVLRRDGSREIKYVNVNNTACLSENRTGKKSENEKRNSYREEMKNALASIEKRKAIEQKFFDDREKFYRDMFSACNRR